MGLSREDISEIEKRGITQEEVERQISIFKRGNIVVDVVEAATIKNGIERFSDEDLQEFINLYDERKEDLSILKFVPASGAATRMFKAFYQFVEDFDPEQESLEAFLDRRSDPVLEQFFSRLKDLPFHHLVWQKMRENHQHVDSLNPEQQQLLFVKTMLLEDGLNYGSFPKGLVPFHKIEDRLLTAFEEHFIEAAYYATSNKKARLHFTVAEDHQSAFEQEYRRIKKDLEERFDVEYEVSFSYQDPKTDTLAVDVANEPFRDDNDKLFFRPGGHGALIGNLDKQNADIIFIKNIDNVVVPRYLDLMGRYKKALAGKLVDLQQQTFQYMRELEKGEVEQDLLLEMISFVKDQLKVGLHEDFHELSSQEKQAYLKKKLNRPIRVCGMVKNEGDPGGGPFWIRNKSGEISLQIVESAQIDHDNYQQSKIAQEATHFNPVDVVCGLKNYKGQPYKLEDYVDQDTSFISNKTRNGRELKALERPGLWNGAMAGWISVFVEVPPETFNPVKTVADLLKPSHQVR